MIRKTLTFLSLVGLLASVTMGIVSLPLLGTLFEPPLVLWLWLAALVFGLVFWVVGTPFHRRRKRKKLGLCLKCGYDLRGSKDRCPECGEEFGA